MIENKDEMTQILQLHAAIKSDSIEVVMELMKSIININIPDKDGNTALFLAIRYNRIDIARKLLERIDNIDFTNSHGNSALHMAIKYDHVSFAKELLILGANPDLQDEHGNSSLQLAVIGNHIEIVEELLRQDINVNLKDKYGMSSLCKAVIYNHTNIINKLLSPNNKVDFTDKNTNTNLRIVIANKNITAAKKLLEKISDINYLDSSNNSFLHIAVFYDCIDFARDLLNRNAVVNVKNINGDTPLHLAINGNHIDFARDLLNRNAVVNVQNINGDTPLHLAINGNHIDFAHDLLNYNADPNLINKKSKTPLHLAAMIKQDNEIIFARLLIHFDRVPNSLYLKSYKAVRPVIKQFNLMKSTFLRGKDTVLSIVNNYAVRGRFLETYVDFSSSVKRAEITKKFHFFGEYIDKALQDIVYSNDSLNILCCILFYTNSAEQEKQTGFKIPLELVQKINQYLGPESRRYLAVDLTEQFKDMVTEYSKTGMILKNIHSEKKSVTRPVEHLLQDMNAMVDDSKNQLPQPMNKINHLDPVQQKATLSTDTHRR